MIDYAKAREFARLADSPAPRTGEIEVQARLFAGEFGTRFVTTSGKIAEVLSFGEWNREAGPDFKGALVRFDEGAPCRGDIEVDMDPRDWELHGHSTNTSFSAVVLQLFVHSGPAAAFARTADHRAVAQARIPVESPTPPPSTVARGVDLATAHQMIGHAAEFRLRMKHEARARVVTLHGPDRALLFAIASGLGYRDNAIPFLLTIQRAHHSGEAAREPLLFGLAGFLEPRTFDTADRPTREYLKPLWDEWWAVRDTFARLVLPRSGWKLSGVRPSNHPHRRMGALAAVVANFPALRKAVKTSSVEGFVGFLEGLRHGFWNEHWNLSAARLVRPVALIGPDRVRDLLVNALLPAEPPDKARRILQGLRAPTPAGKIRRACEWLAGAWTPSLAKSAYQQQGLIQLYNDFGSVSAAEASARLV